MLKLLHGLRRLQRLSSSFPYSSTILSSSIHSQSPHPLFSPTNLPTPQSRFIPNQTYLIPFSNSTFSCRSFCIKTPSPGDSDDGGSFDIEEQIKSELDNLSNFNFYDAAQVADGVYDESKWSDLLVEDTWYDPLLDKVTWGLDKYHDFTGLPWWLVIASSTLALKTVLLPLLVVQIKKMRRYRELRPKLPPPFPPPQSGKGHVEQFLLFWKKKKEIGLPSSLWILASASVQIPSFFLLMGSIRKMSLDHHPGFDCGGILWFQNLTESPIGVFAPIFPIAIAGLHFINVQISFKTPKVHKETSFFGSFKKNYKHGLNLLTIPIFVIGFWIPQGSLVYWFTYNLLTVIQHLCLGQPAVQKKLGLSLSALATSENARTLQNLSPNGLLSLSLRLLADGHKDRAVQVLRSALEKDPEFVRGLVVLGQTLMQQNKLVEASEYLERAISKLSVTGNPTKDEELNLLILASTWAGLTCIHQGKLENGLEHLKRIPQLQEPQNLKGKGHYYRGFVFLASALLNVGQENEAAGYLHRAAAYDPAYKEFLQQLKDEGRIHTSAKR